MALLVLLLFFHLILDINSQYVPQPRLLVSPEVLKVSGSVQLHCDVPHSVKVSQCYFYPERDDANLKLSPSCQLSVTGSELISWTGRSSPGTLHIICYYNVDKSGIQAPSPHSLPAPVTVLNVPQPRLLVSPEVLTVSGSVYLHCDVPHNVKVPQCYFYPERDDTNAKLSPSCQLSVTGSELIRWTGRSSPGTLHIICYYTVDFSVHTPSPHSLPAPVTVLNQKPILSISHDDLLDKFTFVCEIPASESVTAEFRYNLYTGENPQPYLKIKKRQSGKLVCIFTAERNDLFRRLQSVKSDEVSCDYSLISDPTARSLMSDKYNMIHFFPESVADRVTRNHPHISASAPTNSFSPPSMSFTTNEKTATELLTLWQTTTTTTTTITKTKDKSPAVWGVTVILCVLVAAGLLTGFCLLSFPNGDEVYTEVMYTLSSQQLSEETQPLLSSSKRH